MPPLLPSRERRQGQRPHRVEPRRRGEHLRDRVDRDRDRGHVRIGCAVVRLVGEGVRPVVVRPIGSDQRLVQDTRRDPQLDAAVETLMALIQGTPIPTSMPTPSPNIGPTPVH